MHGNAVYIGKQFLIKVMHMTMMGYMVVDNSHLTATNASAYVAQTIVITNLLMLIIRIRLACLCSKKHDVVPSLVVRTDKSPSSTRGYHLIAIKAKHAILAERATDLSFVTRAKAFCSILNNGDIPLVYHSKQLRYFCRHSIQINHNDGLWLASCFCHTVSNSLIKQLRIHVPCVALAVHKNWCRTKIFHRVA